MGAVLSALSYGTGHTGSSGGQTEIVRPSYGDAGTEEKILVSGAGEKDVPVTITVHSRAYTKETAEAAMNRLADTLPERILGENHSLSEVRSNLVLPDYDEETAISIDWFPEDSGLLSTEGEILREEIPESGIASGLTAVMYAGEYSEQYRYPLTLMPSGAEDKASTGERLSGYLASEESRQASEETFRLPGSFEGGELTYRKPPDRTFLLFPVFGVLMALLIPMADRSRDKDRQKKREAQMMRDYPEIVSRLVVYIGAGFPVRRAFEKIATEYERTPGGHPAYDEMALAAHQMARGMPEIQAYESFAARCRLLSYRKLAGLLSQNVRNGSEKLRESLEAEMDSAFEERKNLARRQGEEASTRLILPLILLLAVVMTMVTLPAFLGFTGG